LETLSNSRSISCMSPSASCLRASNSFVALALDGELLALVDHGLDLVAGEPRGGGDRDRLLLARLEVLRVHAHDAVGVDLEGHLDLHHTRGRAPQPVRMNSPSSSFWSACSLLALHHQDLHRRLVVARRGEGLACAPWAPWCPSG
jgi:hypothetical protein